LKKSGIAHYDGLYGDSQARSDSSYLFLEEIVTRSEEFDWSIKSHIHSELVQTFIIEEGSLTFQHSGEWTNLSHPCIILIPPSQQHALTYNPPVNGQILSFSRKIFNDIFKTFLDPPQNIEIIREFEKQDFKTLLQILERIREELFGDHYGREILLRAQLSQFVIEILRLRKTENVLQNEANIGLQHFLRFQKLLDQSNYNRNLADYADELCISQVHLNRICKAHSGKKAIEIVQAKMVDQACKYLQHTSYSVSEIAYKLGFEYPNYFARFFRKQTGVNPSEFRMTNES
jgi:AraC family transcriptional activator of pobA